MELSTIFTFLALGKYQRAYWFFLQISLQEVFCKQIQRRFHLTRTLNINPNNVSEVRIPVPWGHIAGKWWGDTNKQPILALHGWQDNAGTFDPLIELFPESASVLAIDSPGHGLSSHYHNGMFYHNSMYVMTLRRIHNYFKWDKKITIMGHSEGGILAFLFTSIYPELVNALITIDVIKPFSPKLSSISKLGERVSTITTKSTRFSSENPKYLLEEIEDRWSKASKGSLTKDSVKILSRRGVQVDHESGKYFLTRDPKLKLSSLELFDENQSLEMACNFQCHYLVVKFNDSKLIDLALERSPNFINNLTKFTKSFKIVNLDGKHHTHLTHAERVAPVITEFIQSTSL